MATEYSFMNFKDFYQVIVATILLHGTWLFSVAQEYRVESFEILPNDLTARTESRVDGNGRLCGLIKIHVNDAIADVEGPVVGDIIVKGFEKRVYISHDAKQMVIYFQSHAPLNVTFDDFYLPSITTKTTYLLKLVENLKPNNDLVSETSSVNGTRERISKLPQRVADKITHYDLTPDNTIATNQTSTPTTDNEDIANKLYSVENDADVAYADTVTFHKSFASQADKGINSHEWVDLGLPSKTKWATCNIGAYFPADYGDHFVWGEIRPKLEYTKENSQTYGKTLGNIAANSNYDVATAIWGEDWKIPSKEQFEELVSKCTWTWVTIDNRNGYKIIGPNGKSIFMPAAGYRYQRRILNNGDAGFYWSSMPIDDNNIKSYDLWFRQEGPTIGSGERDCGRSVRPVAKNNAKSRQQKANGHDSMTLVSQATGVLDGYGYVDLGLNSGTKWATCNIGANKSEDYGSYFAWGEITTKSSYTEDNCLTYDKPVEDIVMNPSFDAATNIWSARWHLPTDKQCKELIENCIWKWTAINGKDGYLIEGPNGNTIFLPAAGCRIEKEIHSVGKTGSYWMSSPSYYDSDRDARSLYLQDGYYGSDKHKRYKGWSIRPVTE